MTFTTLYCSKMLDKVYTRWMVPVLGSDSQFAMRI